jgi:hypothetical protein
MDETKTKSRPLMGFSLRFKPVIDELADAVLRALPPTSTPWAALGQQQLSQIAGLWEMAAAGNQDAARALDRLRPRLFPPPKKTRPNTWGRKGTAAIAAQVVEFYERAILAGPDVEVNPAPNAIVAIVVRNCQSLGLTEEEILRSPLPIEGKKREAGVRMARYLLAVCNAWPGAPSDPLVSELRLLVINRAIAPPSTSKTVGARTNLLAKSRKRMSRARARGSVT